MVSNLAAKSQGKDRKGCHTAGLGSKDENVQRSGIQGLVLHSDDAILVANGLTNSLLK
jgi:hypothetical protein